MAKDGPKTAPRWPKIAKDRSRSPKLSRRSEQDRRQSANAAKTIVKSRLLGPRVSQDGAQMAPRWPQDGPKTAPRRPKMAPRRPKMAQDRPLKRRSRLELVQKIHFLSF